MPIYVYGCTSCGDKMDISHSIGEKPLTCPVCNSEDTLERDYTTSFNLSKKASTGKAPVGQIVRDFIESTKKEVYQEKENLLREKYDD